MEPKLYRIVLSVTHSMPKYSKVWFISKDWHWNSSFTFFLFFFCSISQIYSPISRCKCTLLNAKGKTKWQLQKPETKLTSLTSMSYGVMNNSSQRLSYQPAAHMVSLHAANYARPITDPVRLRPYAAWSRPDAQSCTLVLPNNCDCFNSSRWLAWIN